MEGNGIREYKGIGKYEGTWHDDKRADKGVFTYESGDKYEGDWKDDKKDGKGK